MRQKIFITLIALLCAFSVYSKEVSIQGVSYALDAETKTAVVIARKKGYSGDVIIPSSIKHMGSSYSVTSIGDDAFYGCSGLTSVTIGNSVTSIGKDAFYECSNLTSVYISDLAAWCAIKFGSYASNPLSYAHNLYLCGELLTELVIPNSVTSIGAYAFKGCSSITSATIPNNVKNIENHAFCGCGKLTSVTIPNSVTSIENHAFVGCASLTAVTIPNSVTSIGDDVFYGCSGLTSVTIPNSVTSIGDYAFFNCSRLTSITIPNSVTSIGDAAFEGCSSLTSVTIPNSVTSVKSILDNAFSRCSSLTSVTINSNTIMSQQYGSRWNLSSIFGKQVTSYIIGSDVTTIAKHAFSGCASLTSVTIGNSVTSIGEDAFYGCSGLTSVTIGNSVTSIGDRAFGGCSGLTSVTIPNSVTSIGKDAFYECSNLTSVYISDLAAWCAIKFGSYASNPLSYAHNLYLNGELLTELVIPNGVKSIGKNAFSECSNLTSVTIPNSVTSIGDRAFGGCSGLKLLTIPNSVTSIGDDAFSGCYSLKVCTASSTSLARSGIPSDRIFCISQEETLAADAKANPKANSNPNPNPNQTTILQKISEPANLTLVDESLIFTDATGNKAIDANEMCHIRFKIRNDGKGEARGCKAKVTLAGSQSGISIQNIAVPTIAAKQSVELDIPVSANMQTTDGNVTFTIEVTEPNGFGTDPMELTVATKAFLNPYLRIVDYSVTSSGGSTKLEKKIPFHLQLMLQNTQYGKAENIEVVLNYPEGVFLSDGNAKTTFASMEGGKSQSIDYEMIVNNNYASDKIPVQVILKEKYGKYAENRTINLEINQMLSSTKLNIEAVEQNNRPEIQLASIGSDVDKNIPTTNAKNTNTFVLIIANEHYSHVAAVPFALNDGNIFREYCIKTLGIGEKHIKYLSDATGNDIKTGINWLANLSEVFDNPQIIVYYAGHGFPDEVSKSAYLLPIDGSGTDVTTGYKLDELYATLGNMPASQITVFMDACFSGSKREDGILASARGVALKAKSGVPQGNMVVFSAAQGDETAYPNREQQHGMFTYYLLKKLQETEGNVDLKTLGDYVIKQVSQQSILLNSKKQTPSVTPSAVVGEDWQNWKLK